MCREKEDATSANLLERILADEEEHIDYLETQLQLMDKLGEQLYLAQCVSRPPRSSVSLTGGSTVPRTSAGSGSETRTCSNSAAPAYDSAMSRIGHFADDDAAAWVVKSPDIGVAMAGFTNAVYNKNRLPMRVRELARMVIALDNECVVCQNTRDSEGIAAGVDEDLYDHAAEWRTWPGYSPQERIAAEFAERFASDHTGLRDDEDFWERAASSSATNC